MPKEYWEEEFKDLFPGVVFKFKKLNSLDQLDLADRNVGKNGESKQFKLDCLRNVVWTKNNSDWFDLMDEYGNCTLQELPPSTLLDIFFKYRNVVCLPVFTESRAYKSLLEKRNSVGVQDKKHSK